MTGPPYPYLRERDYLPRPSFVKDLWVFRFSQAEIAHMHRVDPELPANPRAE